MRKRILKFLELKRLSRLSFYKSTGLSSGFQDKEAEIMEASLRKIANSYQDLNIDWVRTGEGEMIIHGNSMSPKYLEGSRVALKRYPFSPANPLGIQFGKVYAVAVGQGDCYPLLYTLSSACIATQTRRRSALPTSLAVSVPTTTASRYRSRTSLLLKTAHGSPKENKDPRLPRSIKRGHI